MSTSTTQLESCWQHTSAGHRDFQQQAWIRWLLAHTVRHRELNKNPHQQCKSKPQTSPPLLGALRLPGTPAERRNCSGNIFTWVCPTDGNCLQRCQTSQGRKTEEMSEMPPPGLILLCLQQEFQRVPLSQFHRTSQCCGPLKTSIRSTHKFKTTGGGTRRTSYFICPEKKKHQPWC